MHPRIVRLSTQEGSWTLRRVLLAITTRDRLTGINASGDFGGVMMRTRSVHTIGLRGPLHIIRISDEGVVAGVQRCEPGRLVLSELSWVVEVSVHGPAPPIGARLRVFAEDL